MTEKSRTKSGSKGKQPLKAIELRLVSELMKNSRRSDRELARALGVSQPTVSRMISRLEKEGIIKEYTMIPDFKKLGYNILGFTMAKLNKPLDTSGFMAIRESVQKIEKEDPHASLIALSGMGFGKDRIFATFYEDYSAFRGAMELARQIPGTDMKNIESFLVDLGDETNYRLLSLSAIAQHLLKLGKERRNKP
jgi:DNA-binding Lrp family transcriptional regulator